MEVKKLMFAACAVMMAVSAQADFSWSWWVGGDKADKNLNGCQMGIASECKEMTGAQVSLLWGRAKYVHGCQFAFGYCNTRKMQNGPQLAVVNIADHAALQFGLLNFNKGGFLPFFPFFNFDKTMFGGGHK